MIKEDKKLFFDKTLFLNTPKIFLNKSQKLYLKRLKNDIENGVFEYENVICEVCNGNSSEIISKFDRYGLPYESNFCKSCGLVFTSPRFSSDSYRLFYNDYYRKIYYKGLKSKNHFYENQVNKGEKILKIISQKVNLNNINSVLEVGCGMGGILVPFLNNGKEVFGVDLGSEYIEFGRAQNLNLRVGNIKDSKLKKYDLIIYCHVFEHILNLKEELYEIKKRLSPKGYLYIEIPGLLNLEGYGYDLKRFFQNAHTYNFTLITLENTLKICGFNLIYGNEKVQSIFELSNNKIELLNDFERINTSLKLNYEKRMFWRFSRKGFRFILKNIFRRLGILNFIISMKSKFL